MKIQDIIIKTLEEEVVPAMGCTEPVAVALACAKARELVKNQGFKSIKVLVSPNIYKNGLSVGIPNTREVGLYIAAAIGIVAGKSEKDLELFEDITDVDVEKAKLLLKSRKLSIDIKDTDEKIYIEVILRTNNDCSKVIIKNKHNKFVYLEQSGIVLLDDEKNCCEKSGDNVIYSMKIREIIRAIEAIPFSDIKFMLKGLKMNEKVAKAGLESNIGIGVGRSLYKNMEEGLLSYDLMNSAMILTAAASDARMSGITLPVMSSNGSGNNGLAAVLPIAAYIKKFHVDDDELARALAISHIVNSYIKHYIDRLSAICGCGVASATGAAVALAWLMGADDDQIDGVIKNMIGNTSGMICDGAKGGCALKLATSASAAVQSALLALNNSIITPYNGIVGKTAEETIRNLGTLSVEGMNITDHVILKIMKDMQDNSEEAFQSKKIISMI